MGTDFSNALKKFKLVFLGEQSGKFIINYSYFCLYVIYNMLYLYCLHYTLSYIIMEIIYD